MTLRFAKRNASIVLRVMMTMMIETIVTTMIHEARKVTGLGVLLPLPSPSTVVVATRTSPILLGRIETAAESTSVVIARARAHARAHAHSSRQKMRITSRMSQFLAGRTGVIATSIGTGHETVTARIGRSGTTSATMMTRSIDLVIRTRRSVVDATVKPTRMNATTWRKNTNPLVGAGKTGTGSVSVNMRKSLLRA